MTYACAGFLTYKFSKSNSENNRTNSTHYCCLDILHSNDFKMSYLIFCPIPPRQKEKSVARIRHSSLSLSLSPCTFRL